MTSEIKVWEIKDGKLVSADLTTLAIEGRKEKEDLEKWLKSDSSILGDDILIIGEQVHTKTGPMDFLGIDRSGNIVIIELKRDKLARDALAQAIDYASSVATWDADRISEECIKYTGKTLDDFLNEAFDDIDIEEISINSTQRILLVGTYIEEALQRMIEWLSDNYDISINALTFKYVKTKRGDELLAQTMIIPEEIEEEKRSRRKIKIEMSDEPGSYDNDELRNEITKFLSEKWKVSIILKDILLPLCLDHEPVKRDEIKRKLIDNNMAKDEGHAGYNITAVSRTLGIKKRDYLRQIIKYDRIAPWEKDNYRIEERYKDMVRNILKEVDSNK